MIEIATCSAILGPVARLMLDWVSDRATTCDVCRARAKDRAHVEEPTWRWHQAKLSGTIQVYLFLKVPTCPCLPTTHESVYCHFAGPVTLLGKFRHAFQSIKVWNADGW